MKLLNPDELTFELAENGLLRLKYQDGKIDEPVECRALFPLSRPDSYIAVSVRKDATTEELGIIRHLKALRSEQRLLVEKEIQFRYFSPEIIDIKKITTKYGVDQWDVITDKGEKTFWVQDVKENISIRESGLILILDVDRCRYHIQNYRKLPSRAKLELEQTLL